MILDIAIKENELFSFVIDKMERLDEISFDLVVLNKLSKRSLTSEQISLSSSLSYIEGFSFLV